MVLHLCVLLAGVPPLAVFTTQFGYTRFRSVHRHCTGGLGTPTEAVSDHGRRERREGERERERDIVFVCEPINRLTGHSRQGQSGVGISSVLILDQ